MKCGCLDPRGERGESLGVWNPLTEDLLTQAEPASTAAEDHVELLVVLDRAAEQVGRRFAGQPELEAALRGAIARTYHGLASWAKAERQWRAVLEAARRRLGRDSAPALLAAGEVAHILRHRGRLDAEVLELWRSAAEGLARTLGPEHQETLVSRNNLAIAYSDAGRTSEAIALHEGTLKLVESKQGPEHPFTLTIRNNLARAYLDAGRTAQATALLESTLKLKETKLGRDHPDTLTSRNNLADAYRAAGRTAEAIALHEGTLKLRETKLGPDHPDTLQSRNNLADDYEALGRWADAEALLRDALALRRKAGQPDSPLLARDLAYLGSNLLKQVRWSEAEPLLRECLAIREKAIPDDWRRYNTMSQLGVALLFQGRHAEAEPLIVQGYEGMKAREATMPAAGKFRLSEAAEWVVRLYEALGKREEATAWKDKLGLTDLPADVFAQP